MPPPTHLCEKCRRLNLPYHVQREHDTAIRDLGYISGEIIDKNCSQCVQFSNILRRSSSQANTTSGSEAFSLQVKHLQLDGYSSTLLAPANRDLERDSRRYLAPVHAPPHSWVAYFGLTGQRSGRTLHLLPRQVYFIDSRSEKHSYSPFCRKLNENFADYEFLRDHLELCQSEHSNTCPTSIQDGRWLPARLIDCESRLLCPAQDKQYACLSYVWGDVPADRASSDKVFGVGIPQTVADAMVVTRELGIRYLWVDRYCIDQSNAAEKHKTIRNMDSIYRNASVTIVAAAGSDSSYGLPGVSRPRKVSRSCKIGGRTFIAVNDPAQDMRAAVWSTRGWTYQEMMLSRRLIFFTDCQIYFQCREQLVMEQLEKEWADRTTRGDFQAINPMTWLPYAHGSVYQAYDLIIEYYGRTLRYRADSINAFAGMFRDLAERTQRLAPRPSTFLSAPDLQQLCLPRENPHFYGIPVVKSIYRPCDEAKISSEFGLSLAWAVKGSQDENPLAHNQSTADHDFPSWTWASRKAQRSEHDPGELTYLGDATLKNEDPKMELSMSVTHRSGQRMNMVEYVSQTADYTFFHPWLDIATLTARGNLKRKGRNTYTFSGLPGSVARLDRIPRHTAGPVSAMYLGVVHDWFSAHGIHPISLFLLLEQVGEDEFRRIGICTRCDKYLQRLPQDKGRYAHLPKLHELGLLWPTKNLVADEAPAHATQPSVSPQNTWPTTKELIESGALQQSKLRII